MEDDAKFQNEKGGNLLTEALLSRSDVDTISSIILGKFLLVGCCHCLSLDLEVGVAGPPISSIGVPSNSVLDVYIRLKAVFDLNVALGAEIEEEDDYHRSEDDCRTPGVVRPAASHANAGSRPDLAVRWIEEMDESCCNDDAGAEVPDVSQWGGHCIRP